MIANHIHDALSQVRRLQDVLLERRKFRGFSGPARIFGGGAALLGALLLSRLPANSGPVPHLVGWGIVLLVALVFNYGLLAFWLASQRSSRSWTELAMPAFDAFPALAMGALLSLAAILNGFYDLLFGIWMGLYGVVHTVYRSTLPLAIYGVGLFYMACAAGVLLLPGLAFTNPWPMGLVFFAGESAGGLILYLHRNPGLIGKEASV